MSVKECSIHCEYSKYSEWEKQMEHHPLHSKYTSTTNIFLNNDIVALQISL